MLGAFQHREHKPNNGDQRSEQDEGRTDEHALSMDQLATSFANSNTVDNCQYVDKPSSSNGDGEMEYAKIVSPAATQVDAEPEDLSLRSKRPNIQSLMNGMAMDGDFDQPPLIDHINASFGKASASNADIKSEPFDHSAPLNSIGQQTQHSNGADSGGGISVLYCQLCNATCSNEMELLEHFRSHDIQGALSHGNSNGGPEVSGHSITGRTDELQQAKGAIYCALCDQEFCNEQFLKTHMTKTHGINPDGIESQSSARQSFKPDDGTQRNDQAPKHSPVSPTFDIGNAAAALGYSPSFDHQSNAMSAFSQQNICPFCHQYLPNAMLLQSHLLTSHAGLLMNPTAAAYAASLMSMNPFGSGNIFQQPQTNGKSNLQNQQQQISAIAAAAAILGFGTPNGVNVPGPHLDYFAQGLNHTPTLLGQSSSFLPSASSTALRNAGIAGQHVQGMDLEETKPSLVIPQTPAKNLDAYCDICQKEFCNKYFLRTHKLNKHGILEESPKSNNGSGKYGRDPNSKSPNGDSPGHRVSVMDGREISNDARKESIIADILSAATSSSDEGGPPPNKIAKIRKADADAEQPSHTAPVSGGQFQCNLCVKTFPSMFALVAHKYRDHGTFDGAISAASGLVNPNSPAIKRNASTSSSPVPMTSSNFGANSHQQRNHRKSIDSDLSYLSSPMKNLAAAQSVDLEAYCEICQKEFCSKYFLKVHRANIHGIGTTTSPGASSTGQGQNGGRRSLNGSGSNGPMRTGSPGAINLAKIDENGRRTTTNGGPSVAALMAAAVGAGVGRPLVASKNFCDICNKELCNKYFLRTHMLKMHGIVIDENKTVIANINTLDKEKTGELLFRCDLCGEQLASRQQLRAHKQSVHQIVVPPTSLHLSANSASNSTSLDNGTNHRDVAQNSINVESVDNQSAMMATGEKTDSAVESGNDSLLSSGYGNADCKEVLCTICGGRYKSARFLRMHILNDHADVVGQKEKNSAGAMCEYCFKEFPDHAKLQWHVINEHQCEVRGSVATMAEQAALDSVSTALVAAVNSVANAVAEAAVANGTSARNTAAESEPVATNPQNHRDLPLVTRGKNGTKLFRCTYCNYYTRWISNLSTHEKRHNVVKPVDGENGEKPFKCKMCLRSYRYSHSLQRHMEVHRSAALGFRASSLNQALPSTTISKHLDTPVPDGAPLPALEHNNFSENPPEKSVDKEQDSKDVDKCMAISTASSISESPSKRHHCHLCGKEFGNRELYRMHVITMHNIVLPEDSSSNDIPTKGLFRCRQCQFTAAKFYDLRMHTLQKHGVLAGNNTSPQKKRAHVKSISGDRDHNEIRASNEKSNGVCPLKSDFTVQAFMMKETSNAGIFPSSTVVYLPVLHRVNNQIEATFTFTPVDDANGDVENGSID